MFACAVPKGTPRASAEDGGRPSSTINGMRLAPVVPIEIIRQPSLSPRAMSVARIRCAALESVGLRDSSTSLARAPRLQSHLTVRGIALLVWPSVGRLISRANFGPLCHSESLKFWKRSRGKPLTGKWGRSFGKVGSCRQSAPSPLPSCSPEPAPSKPWTRPFFSEICSGIRDRY